MADYFMNTYHRLPVTFVRGEGCYLFDDAGKEHLDFSSGIAVNCLGHRHPALLKAVREQSEKLLHVSNYYQCGTSAAFARNITQAAGMKKVFLCNSGAEANEGACKVARKYSAKKYGGKRHVIVTLEGSFHGRTITTLSATGQPKFHQNFGSFTPGFRFVKAGDIAGLDMALDEKVAGLLIEPVQGESGVIPMPQEFMTAAAEICAKRDILLMLDEIQCGNGRTGAYLAATQYGVQPDVVTLAKGIAGGIPCGAFLADDKAAGVLEVGDHGSTFGGNPLAAACGNAVLEIVNNKAFLAEIAEKGAYFIDGLKALNSPKITAVRGMGLISACDLTVDAWPVLEKALDAGLLMLSAGAKTLRFLPPYIITKEEIDKALQILDEILRKG